MVTTLLVAAAVFGLCYLVDKGFIKLFRSAPQHRTGLSVRLGKRFATVGILMTVLGTAAIVTGLKEGWVLPAAGGLLVVLGLGMLAYYLSYGVFYDEDSFLVSRFGKQTKLYHYRDIQAQQLYNAYGSVVIELQMNDDKTIQLQANMVGVYPFMDQAFEGWLKQTGRKKENCTFYDPDNSCWFPTAEE